MKSTAKRPYRQTVRAEAAEDTARRVLDAFVALFTTHWYDQITLDAVAASAGVTVQTVIRRFGSKEGLLIGTFERMSGEITQRRTPDIGSLERTIDAVVDDYEQSGDFVLRTLAQEGRFPLLDEIIEMGRGKHRSWVTAALGPLVADRSPARRRDAIDGLVVATDLYTWKLLRRDMGRTSKSTQQMMLRLALGVIEHGNGG